ncbi:MAG: hypothetical protein HY821_22535 [Acidobacteria bacterium]|nr:hypothetical protein [Acidobacteriota bacterium]
MPEEAKGTDALNLLKDFPAVPAETWEQTIAADLKGADYEKKLVWKTDEGIAVRPYYRKENLPEKPFRHCVTKSWEILESGQAPAGVDATVYHEAGATAVQELAYAMAAASELLAAAKPVPAITFAVGSNYFFEIAKLRAARLLYTAVAQAYGVSKEVKIGAVTALANKSIYDPYTNLLRSTTEALSAVLGGADSLAVQPAGYPARLARNVQLVLKEESHLDKVADPAGGSYDLEALTDSLAAAAWTLFQRVEAAGGLTQAQAAVDAAIAASRASKDKAIASRRRAMVGVNNYPDIHEKELDEAGSLPASAWRLAKPIEEIRLRTESHARQAGRTPKVLLLKRGDLKMKMARAQFCQNFFGCAGFAIEENESYAGTDAALIVLCSSDPEYVDFAKEVCAAVKVPVVVAGNPKEQMEELKAAGVAGFVHVLSNMVDTLTEWQNKLGIAAKEAK